MLALFITVSFMSITFAWFAYTGLARMTTEIDVKAWLVEMEQNGVKISGTIEIALPELHPGMETVKETVTIKNLGDTDASVRYAIESVQIFDEANYVINHETITSEYMEDMISQEFPFRVNMSLSKNFVVAKGENTTFEAAVSWPLDSGNDDLDSEWGMKASNFKANHGDMPAIKIVINIIADQYLDIETSSDTRFKVGGTVLFDVVNNSRCSSVGGSCLETNIIDVNNTLEDDVVSLLPNTSNAYSSGTFNDYDTLLSTISDTWTVDTRPLTAQDVLSIISMDVTDSVLVRTNLSDAVIGSLSYGNRMTSVIEKAVNSNAYFKFSNSRFDYLSSMSCYWVKTEYNATNAFALEQIDDDHSKLYGYSKNQTCKVIPVILVSKAHLY